MKIFLSVLAAALIIMPLAVSAHDYIVTSPTHGQTFAYGSEGHRAWVMRGTDRHLALVAEFTNDPYVDRFNPRQIDDFTFDFPTIRLGADGRTFYYHAHDGKTVPVARRHKGFLGLGEVSLISGNFPLLKKPHGYLTLSILVNDQPASASL